MDSCDMITGKGFKFIKGVEKLNISYCYSLKDQGFKFLKGIKWLNMSCLKRGDGRLNVTGKCLKSLKGVEHLDVRYSIYKASKSDFSGFTCKKIIISNDQNTAIGEILKKYIPEKNIEVTF